MLRQPIVAMMGHVDHGKTSLLDSIRSTSTAAREAGGITQAIGASIIPADTLQKVCGPLLKAANLKLTIPGLLFIDTPGHAAFTNLRKRGGNLADVAILVVDISEGLKPQSLECVEILKAYKTPFIIAANKIDKLGGFNSKKGVFLQNLNSQSPQVKQLFETKMYEIVGKLHELGFESERFDRVDDYAKQIAIVPTCAISGEGVSELLMVLSGLTQKFMEQKLNVNLDGPAKGTILEVKEEKGLGKTADLIIYDGTLAVGDKVVIGGLHGAISTKIKALFEPAPLAEMREKKTKYKSVKSVIAATGVKIATSNMDEVVAGMPIIAVNKEKNNESEIIEIIKKDIAEIMVHTDDDGIIVKADSLGSLEALTRLLNEHDILIKKAAVGSITKKDIIDAEASFDKEPLNAVILGFNIPETDLKPESAKIFVSPVIYKLIENYEKWVKEESDKMQKEALASLVQLCRLKIIPGFIFRQSNPAVVGVDVEEGILKAGTNLMKKDGIILTRAKSIQKEQDSVQVAKKNEQVAVSLPDVIVGRQIKEGEILYSALNEYDYRAYKENKKFLTAEQKQLLKEIAEIMRANNPVWGV